MRPRGIFNYILFLDSDIIKLITIDIHEEFKTIVNEISVEIINENEDSIIEFTIPLK